MATGKMHKAVGLYTYPNKLSAIPEGSLGVADNVVIRNAHLIESRRGQSIGLRFGANGDLGNTIAFYQNGKVMQYTAISGTTPSLAYDTGNEVWVQYSGTFTPPDPTLLRMKFVESQQSLFFTTNAGIKVLTSLSGTPASAGVFRALDPSDPLNPYATFTGTGAWMQANAVVGYKVVWGIEDAYGRVLLGPPSGTMYAATDPSGGSTLYSPVFNIPIPQAATTSHFVQVYRTATSASSTTAPVAAFSQILELSGYARTNVTAALGEASGTGGIGTVTVAHTAHGFTVGQQVMVTTARTATVSGTFDAGIFVVATVPDANHFTYVQNSSVNGTSTGTIVYQLYSIRVTDYFPEALLAKSLYTDTNTGDTVTQTKDQPPLGKDIALWDERLWIANTTCRHRFTLQMLGVGAPDGLQTGDTITVGGQTYTARTSLGAGSSLPLREFVVHTASTASVNTTRTAQHLVDAINANPSNTTLMAFFNPVGANGLGEITIEELAVGGSAFTVYASRQSTWTPYLTTSSSGAKTSKNDAFVNRLFYSRFQEPEAVPLLNYLDVGSRSKQIQRIIKQGDKLFVFKEDGIFLVSGNYPYYSVSQIDSTTTLVAADTAVPFNNRVFALTNRGVCAITDTSVTPVSLPINDSLVRWNANTNNKRYSWACAYESDRMYLLGLAQTSTTGAEVWVYNGLEGGAWTRWPISRTFAAVDPYTDCLNLIAPDRNGVYVERKAFTYADYYDSDATTYVLNSVSGSTWTLATNIGISVGSFLTCSGGGVAKVLTVGAGETVTVVMITGSAVTGSISLLSSIPCAVEWNPESFDGPDIAKHFTEYTLHFQRLNAYAFTSSFKTENYTAGKTPDLACRSYTYTGVSSEQENIRRAVPLETQRGALIRVGVNIAEAYAWWTLAGWSIEFEPVSQRNAR